MPSLVALLAALVVMGSTPRAGLSPRPSADVGSVRIASQSARWTSLQAADELKDGGETMFLISGEIENTGSKPVRWVKLEYELLADTPAGEAVLASEYGYNLRAEGLRSPAVDAGAVPATAAAVRSLAPGEKDLFRMLFFRADVPHFDRWRVHILEVR